MQYIAPDCPEITGRLDLEEGDTLNLGIRFPDGFVGQVQYQWRKDGQDLPTATGASLIINDATLPIGFTSEALLKELTTLFKNILLLSSQPDAKSPVLVIDLSEGTILDIRSCLGERWSACATRGESASHE